MSIILYKLYDLIANIRRRRKNKFYVAMKCNLAQLIQNELFMTCGRCRYYEEDRGCRCRELGLLKYLR